MPFPRGFHEHNECLPRLRGHYILYRFSCHTSLSEGRIAPQDMYLHLKEIYEFAEPLSNLNISGKGNKIFDIFNTYVHLASCFDEIESLSKAEIFRKIFSAFNLAVKYRSSHRSVRGSAIAITIISLYKAVKSTDEKSNVAKCYTALCAVVDKCLLDDRDDEFSQMSPLAWMRLLELFVIYNDFFRANKALAVMYKSEVDIRLVEEVIACIDTYYEQATVELDKIALENFLSTLVFMIPVDENRPIKEISTLQFFSIVEKHGLAMGSNDISTAFAIVPKLNQLLTKGLTQSKSSVCADVSCHDCRACTKSTFGHIISGVFTVQSNLPKPYADILSKSYTNDLLSISVLIRILTALSRNQSNLFIVKFIYKNLIKPKLPTLNVVDSCALVCLCLETLCFAAERRVFVKLFADHEHLITARITENTENTEDYPEGYTKENYFDLHGLTFSVVLEYLRRINIPAGKQYMIVFGRGHGAVDSSISFYKKVVGRLFFSEDLRYPGFIANRQLHSLDLAVFTWLRTYVKLDHDKAVAIILRSYGRMIITKLDEQNISVSYPDSNKEKGESYLCKFAFSGGAATPAMEAVASSSNK